MKNVSHQFSPQTWDDYFGQEEATRLAKQFIIHGIDDEKGLPRCIFVSGHSGVGKTTFVKLLLRSFRCLNRAPGEYNPCGECENCTKHVEERLGGRAYGDTIWVQPGSRELGSIQSQVKEALIQASNGHTHTGRPDRDVLFIIFDEFQAFASDLQQEVLLKTEVEQENNNVCFIFITMLEEKIGLQQRIALIRRSCPIHLQPFLEEDIVVYLRSRYPQAPLETLKIVAAQSEQSPGLALVYMDLIRDKDEEMLPDVASHILKMATPSQRRYLWECLEKEINVLDLKKMLQELERYAAASKLAHQMIEDIIMSVDAKVTKEQLYGIELLNQFLRNHGQLSLLSHLIPLLGLKRLINPEIFSDSQTLNYALQS